jgi:hypothetical protein
MIRFPALATPVWVFICGILAKTARACAAECGFCLNTADVNGQFEAIALELGSEMSL